MVYCNLSYIFACWVMFLVLSADFFISKLFFYSSITLSGFLTVCIDVLSAMIWVQIVYKGYQQTTKDTASKERVK